MKAVIRVEYLRKVIGMFQVKSYPPDTTYLFFPDKTYVKLYEEASLKDLCRIVPQDNEVSNIKMWMNGNCTESKSFMRLMENFMRASKTSPQPLEIN